MENYKERYKEALERAQKMQENSNGMILKKWLWGVFPELKEKESEDERIRKEIIDFVKSRGGFKGDWLTWLEKQCKQNSVEWSKEDEKKPIFNADHWYVSEVDGKIHNMTYNPTDKVESKFKPGDWIIFNGLILHIDEVVNGYYRTTSIGDGIHNSYDWDIDNAARLWTIQDAKDGNVLAYVTDEEDLWIMIYRSLYEPYEGHVHYHALLVNDNFSDKGTCCICIDNLKPATKEQRELLFQKMKEEGYEWDSEKKELKKIEPKFKVGDFIANDYCSGKVIEITNDAYLLDTGQGIPFSYEHNAHLWTTEDAKDGDVLVDEDNNIGLYREEKDDLYWHSYIYIGCDNCLRGFGGYHNYENTKPATKEQCELLFQKMKEAGYEWNNDKKELKKMEVVSEESEDERIRKAIIRILKGETGYTSKEDTDKYVTWLEEQGEQPADKVEPKFKVGDGITDGYIYYKITEILDDRYIIESKYDKRGAILFEYENRYHLWTIEDAKDGDVLVNGSNIFIFHFINGTRYFINGTRLMGYCHVNVDDNKFYIDNDPNTCFGTIDAEFTVASQEQHDILFAKMKEAGYEWDSKKKELNKIEQKTADKTEPKFKVRDWILNDVCFPLQIASIRDGMYVFTEGDAISVSFVDEHLHLWTIQDAMDGDVLINWNNTIFIFNAIEDETVKFHIAYNEKWDTIKTPSTKLSHLGLPEPQFEFHPATKEQCELLFQKMKEAGYEWDNKKKELKKI